jgi:PPK2 family polyphosphate:nucleotide phosphotransferase
VRVVSFKAPSGEELSHDYLWRSVKALPERGGIGIFNRSYYEEVAAVRVHAELLDKEKLPPDLMGKSIWEHRFQDINGFERYLVRNGIVVLKFFLHLSKKEQKRRLLERVNKHEKNWKLSPSDIAEREFWDDYMKTWEETINQTSSEWAPWYIVPADHKWHSRIAVADLIVSKMESLKLSYPATTKEQEVLIEKARTILEAE